MTGVDEEETDFFIPKVLKQEVCVCAISYIFTWLTKEANSDKKW